jgi:hypothetical protein
MKGATFKEVQAGGQTVHENQNDRNASFVLVGGTTVLIGPAPVLRAVLERRGGPKHPPGLQAALAKAGFAQTCVCAGDVKLLSTLLGPGQAQAYLDTVHGGVLSVQVGDDLTVRLTVACKDAETTEDARRLLDGCLVVCKYAVKGRKGLPEGFPAQEALDALRKAKVTSEGGAATAALTVPAPVLARAVRSLFPKGSP